MAFSQLLGVTEVSGCPWHNGKMLLLNQRIPPFTDRSHGILAARTGGDAQTPTLPVRDRAESRAGRSRVSDAGNLRPEPTLGLIPENVTSSPESQASLIITAH